MYIRTYVGITIICIQFLIAGNNSLIKKGNINLLTSLRIFCTTAVHPVIAEPEKTGAVVLNN